MVEERLLLICNCHDVEHQIQFVYDPEEFDDGFNCIYVQAHLTKNTFFRRLGYAIKYIFGYQSKYGAFTEIILHENDVDRMLEHFNKFKNREQG